MLIFTGAPIINNCFFFGNTLKEDDFCYGGGIRSSAFPTITNCVFKGNVIAAPKFSLRRERAAQPGPTQPWLSGMGPCGWKSLCKPGRDSSIPARRPGFLQICVWGSHHGRQVELQHCFMKGEKTISYLPWFILPVTMRWSYTKTAGTTNHLFYILNIETGDPPAGWVVQRTISNKEFRTAEVFKAAR